MIEIKKNKIIVDGIEKEINKINVINLSRNYLSFSGRIADCVKYENDINSVYEKLTEAKLSGFLLIGNNIVNLNNITSLHIEYYQYAGISIHKCSPGNAEMYLLALVCKNGIKETIAFRTHKEAEQCYHEIDTALTQLRNEEAANRLLNA